ncbi:hypothetical protein O6H91_05G010700 [Diphasiastrum complanatum]|uniref:Uncharacterized protein n=2 Tax=Diphasiastrum complanatum TaxID=34168 RepID=A0ACC2DLC8_DIPCM|nr:hypothetical protein O6H91_05G008300 [Diphasiastrum complanatum]KAJ7554822.1 hypothetical protein O6H91_05G010700 [Diphasiastrum complanatum]
MPGNPQASLFICNLDERVDERLLYEIMVQAGPLVDVYIPRDKETKRHKGYGFAEYNTEESAQYALTLFSGLVSLYKRLVRFSISGADKSSSFGGDKLAQALDSPSSNMNNTHYGSPKAALQQHVYPTFNPVHSNIYHNSPMVSLQQQHLHPAYNHAQVPVYGIQSGEGFPNPNTVLNTAAYAQNYNSQLSMLGQQALHTPPYFRHPHAHSSY